MHYSSSDNYLWNTIDSLGKGATGGVFKGRHMKTGNSVAIKVFNTETNSFWRELDILKNTPMHDNIVKFISMETELSSKRRVIIMELCTGGSLYNIIDHPENGFGLSEDELMSVIRDVVSGLNHLHLQKGAGMLLFYIATSQAPSSGQEFTS
ncbi:hypothetical protein LOD99_10499 [Oopsacas minuta]|uniref:Protein kinase domain-containing protein n=1 Tax=Oopsacas minuta TaxID=111878 RepID=A0AAV7KH16_9METZ|nr:hypothetical protein LOD99_10499 [Oopsacas minuta]